jgi:uncharacterized protein (DUF1015 family)
MLYSDPQREVDKIIWDTAEKLPPDFDLKDEYEVRHQLWKISDHTVILALRDKMGDKNLIIADGHHRYETALAYRNQRRSEENAGLAEFGRTGQLTIDLRAPYEHVMATMINMEDEGLLILPTHRVVHGLKDFHPDELLRAAAAYFDITELPSGLQVEEILSNLANAGAQGTALVAKTQNATCLLRTRPEAVNRRLSDLPALQRALDVVQLHKLLLEDALHISEEDIRNQTNLEYLRDPGEALDRVTMGRANVAFLMNPVRIEQMREVAFAGQVMPQKSTDFYPKLLSGITIYDVA